MDFDNPPYLLIAADTRNIIKEFDDLDTATNEMDAVMEGSPGVKFIMYAPVATYLGEITSVLQRKGQDFDPTTKRASNRPIGVTPITVPGKP